jgi:ketosteroid isomerase-like protein
MTSRSHIEAAVGSLWESRLRGDLEATLKDAAENIVFRLNARGTGQESLSERAQGKAAIRPILRQLIDTWRFDDWKQISFLIDGEKALLHWTAHATCVPTGKSADFDVFDLFTFQDGKIVDYHQSTDTALMMSLAT